MTKTQLEVGDVIYTCYRQKAQSKSTIERVTKTLAIARSGNRFKRDCTNGIRRNGLDFDIMSYSLETPELKSALYRTRMIKKVKENDLDSLPVELLESIISAIAKGKTT